MRSVRRRTSVVILRSELVGLASPSQLSRVLAKLLEAGKLVRVSHGVYAKTRFNKFLATVLSVKGFWNETDETMHSTASLF
jgi:hypothetical protein